MPPAQCKRNLAIAMVMTMLLKYETKVIKLPKQQMMTFIMEGLAVVANKFVMAVETAIVIIAKKGEMYCSVYLCGHMLKCLAWQVRKTQVSSPMPGKKLVSTLVLKRLVNAAVVREVPLQDSVL